MKLIITTFLFCIFISLSGYGQRIAFENLTVDNGLSQNSVLAIVQDSRGFMWYGTQHGLNKYNTRSFKIYKNNPADQSSISSDYITSLVVDSHKVLWVGTRNGLNKYNPETDSFERVKLSLHITGAEIISAVYEDKRRNMWVWSSDGLYRFSNATGSFNSIAVPDSVAGLYGTNVHTLYQDRGGNYWIGSSAGLSKMQETNGRYTYQMYKHDDKVTNSLSDNYVTTIAEDAANNLWIGTLHGGVNFFNKSSGNFTRFLANNGANGPANNNIRVLQPEKSGKIWIGTQSGLNILNLVTKQFVTYRHDPEDKNSLSQNSIYSVFIDNSNTVWVGTYWGGINMVSNPNTTFLTYQTARYHSAINNNVVSAVAEDEKHNLWIGTEGGGLNYFDRKADVVTTYQNKINDPASLGSDLVKVIYIDKDRSIWIGTHGGGLNLFNPASHSFKRFLYKENDPVTLGSEVLSILHDSEGNLWVGTQSGLLIFRKKDSLLEHVDQPVTGKIGKKSVMALMEDSGKNIWIATANGLYKTNRNHTHIKVYKTEDGLKSNDINCIYQDTKKWIWAGSYYGGLAKYDEVREKFITYTEKEGLTNNNVLSILEDEKNNLWMGTGNGLSRFSIATQTFKNYSKNDGLGGNTFNINSCYKTSDGEMLFGGLNGLSSFFPSKIEDNAIPPPVIITALKLFNQAVGISQPDNLLSKDISLTQNVVFSHAQNVFTIDFAALNYIKSDKNKYAYKLEPFDKDWVHTDIPSAPYTNLSPGNYTFFAKGSNNDGVWGKAVTLHIKVLPPFWETTWAYCLYVLFIGSIVFLLARFFILRSLLRRDKELTHLKLNFFTNISHEIRTHLSLIFGPVEKLILEEKDGTQTRQLQVIKKNSDSLLQLVNELMDFRKAETGNLKLHIAEHNVVTTISEIYNSFYDHAVSANITIDLVTSADYIPLYFDKIQLEKVFFNLLHNAFKFTNSGGYINVLVVEGKDHVTITVADNGKGIAPENLKNLFENYFQENDLGKQNTGYGIGLALSKSIIELHKGSIAVDSKIAHSGNKTSFVVKLRKGTAHFKNTDLVQSPVNDFLNVQRPVLIDNLIMPAIESAGSSELLSKEKKHTVLLVEDNPEVRSFIADFLQNRYEVVACENGVKGLEAAKERIPDVIISDVMMPEMDGFTLCNNVKADERTNHIPVILLTARASGASHIEGLKMGADVYLTKPFSIEVLLLQITNLLNASERIRKLFKEQITATDNHVLNAGSEKNDQATQELVSIIDNEFINKLVRIIEKDIDNLEFGVPELAREIGMSQPVLYKKLDAVTGMSVNDFIKSIKMNNAGILLKTKRYTINEVAYMVGFSDRKYFSKEFKKRYGKTPTEFME
ncbi:Two component regulator propeller [Mucilaginibacter gossypiicola]|uniref:histidine kinase n=1 Tax=Mucilaginibacter gossypiicola TaxID=551995 RepID=A0A1H8UJG5_9SPHI|nr:two-component regulator propeller domain-containing protein [Mucilaginibacter gossypiicola]SEP03157.1 Two component regulator propeller [Mucilaginibacter gossypiicola]